MKKQYKLIFAILFVFNLLLAVVGIVIGASFPTIVMEGDNASMGLGKLLLEYLSHASAWNDEYHIKMEIK